jgi:hypothetical protein
VNVLIMQFSLTSCHLFLFGPNILLSTMFSNTLSLSTYLHLVLNFIIRTLVFIKPRSISNPIAKCGNGGYYTAKNFTVSNLYIILL